jgi:hypothetical protein
MFVILKFPESLRGGSLLGPLGVVSALAIEDQNWTHFNSGFLISRTILPHTGSSYSSLLCLYLVSCTQKMCWTAHSLADKYHCYQPFYSVPQNWVKTEVLVCPVYALHEFILLDNSIRLLYFHIYFPVFPPRVYNCCLMDHTYNSHKSLVHPHLYHYVTFTPERWLPFFQALTFPI